MVGLTSKAGLNQIEELREKVKDFIHDEITNEQDVINITETAMTGGSFSITIWYKKRF